MAGPVPTPCVREVAKWYKKAAFWAPLAMAVEQGINWLFEEGRAAAAAAHTRGIAPGAVVADAFARTLVASGRFDQVRTLGREPVGEDRRQIDALVRVTVPAWGVVRVREGKPDVAATRCERPRSRTSYRCRRVGAREEDAADASLGVTAQRA